VFIGGNRFGEFVEIDLHRLRGDFRHDQSKGIVRARFNCAEDVSIGISLIGAPGRAHTFGIPAVTDASLLPGPRFVLEEQPDFLAWIGPGNRFQAIRKAPLKAAWAASSFLGWWGRAFWREKPRRCRTALIPVGP